MTLTLENPNWRPLSGHCGRGPPAWICCSLAERWTFTFGTRMCLHVRSRDRSHGILRQIKNECGNEEPESPSVRFDEVVALYPLFQSHTTTRAWMGFSLYYGKNEGENSKTSPSRLASTADYFAS